VRSRLQRLRHQSGHVQCRGLLYLRARHLFSGWCFKLHNVRCWHLRSQRWLSNMHALSVGHVKHRRLVVLLDLRARLLRHFPE
jgi:hypothetical protein